MAKRELLKWWWDHTAEPAPKTTVLKVDPSCWVVVSQGRTLPDSDHDTWAEAMEAATR